jgi:threonine dehydrogenase-like Zn-dependent dehydrogenase
MVASDAVTRMKALVLAPGAAPALRDVPRPAAPPGECRVAVTCAGVCATDLALGRGYMDFRGVPGHEFVGRALDGPLAGRRVVGEINAGCGTCSECAGGDARHCERRTVLGILGRAGAFAEELLLPARNLLAVPDALDDEEAVFAEPLAAALAVTDALGRASGAAPGDAPGDEPGDVAGLRVLVAGDGRLGLLCAHALSLAGARVTVAGRHPERAALLPAGATHRTGLLEAGAQRADDEARYPAAVEATGDPAVLPRLLARVHPRGTVVLKTTSESPTPLDTSALVVNEQRLVGSRCGRLGPALEELLRRRVPVRALIHARYTLDEAPAALERAARPGVLKVLVRLAPLPARPAIP